MVFIDSDLLIKCIRADNQKNPKYSQELELARGVMEFLFQKYKKVKITLFNYAELYRGAYSSKKVANNLRLVEQYCSNFDIILPSLESAKEFARLSTFLESKGIMIGILDVLIASVVIISNDFIITGNLDHFERIPDIRCVHWKDFQKKP